MVVISNIILVSFWIDQTTKSVKRYQYIQGRVKPAQVRILVDSETVVIYSDVVESGRPRVVSSLVDRYSEYVK